MSDFAAVVLAGSRGEDDPLAQQQRVRHRALLEVAGVPMLLRVVRTLRQTTGVGTPVVSIDDPHALDGVPELASLVDEGALRVHRSLASPSRSVLDVLESLGDAQPVLVTTADHALLTPEIARHFLDASEGSAADVLVGLVNRRVIEARLPESTRTYLRFRDDDYSGANLFAFRSAAARRAAAFWVRAERFRKQPWRLVRAFGPVSLLLFALRRLDLDAALERASRTIGARVEAVRLPFAEAAVDVDRPSDLALVTRLLEQRKAAKRPRSEA
jgi:GTP:adenosylcobinamide-phosphate guanylyltransferase